MILYFEPDEPSDSIKMQVVAMVRYRKCCSKSVLISSFHPVILARIAELDNTLSTAEFRVAHQRSNLLRRIESKVVKAFLMKNESPWDRNRDHHVARSILLLCRMLQ